MQKYNHKTVSIGHYSIFYRNVAHKPDLKYADTVLLIAIKCMKIVGDN